MVIETHHIENKNLKRFIEALSWVSLQLSYPFLFNCTLAYFASLAITSIAGCRKILFVQRQFILYEIIVCTFGLSSTIYMVKKYKVETNDVC